MSEPRPIEVFALAQLPEVVPGDDLAALILTAARGRLRAGDLLVVASKIVSKAEGRIVQAEDREDAITAETVRVVATREHPGGITRIVQNRQGIVGAAAGVDSSNTAPGTVLLLPTDPDGSARALRRELEAALQLKLGVVITDTLGRPWREGQTDVAIGAAGVRVLDDLRGEPDGHGRVLKVAVTAAADEVAAAADLVKGKNSGHPVAVVRGLSRLLSDETKEEQPGAASLVRSAERDMFRWGSNEAWQLGYAAARQDAGLPPLDIVPEPEQD